MSRTIARHGTANRYSYGCRCTPCTKAATRADAERKLDRLAGRPRQIPAAPAAEHAKKLLERGLTVTQVAREAGLEPSTIRRLVNGQKEMLAANAAKVLAVPLDVRVSSGDVPALGATRRIRALYALGHFNWRIAQEAGVSRDTISALAAGLWPTIKVSADDGIRAAYDRLCMKTGTSAKTRILAQRRGWAPPLAWEEEAIDDPSAVPQFDAEPATATEGENLVARWLMGESVVLGAEHRDEALLHLFEWTSLSSQQIADRLGMSKASAEAVWFRAKRKARAEGRREPWRRVWSVERPMKQNEMEEAA
ncbi:helix-turn-helix domain-containing protein [Streptomyces griseosporeus]|uniref:helix-turn-helix domain-containing protein n=1 Tax=Streptomyces griseosporeus TaxID=1910 RepID=UPI0036FF2C5E